MKTLKIYGASDDLVEAFGIEGGDEFNAYISGNGCYAKRLGVRSAEGNINIHCIYDGSWAFAVTACDGDDFDKMPDWPMRRSFGRDSRYSETLEIDCPDDAKLVKVKRGKE